MVFGSFSEMSLLEVLKFLNESELSGVLKININNSQGKIEVQNGLLVSSIFQNITGMDVLWKINNTDNGSFEFHKDMETTGTNLVNYPTPKLLKMLETSQASNKPQGSFSHTLFKINPDFIPVLNPDKELSRLNANNRVLKILLQANGMNTIKEIAFKNKVSTASVCKIFERLMEHNYVELIEQPDEVLPQITPAPAPPSSLKAELQEEIKEEEPIKPSQYWRGRKL